jgi:branched-chain amino acid transport system substrate-binding protein
MKPKARLAAGLAAAILTLTAAACSSSSSSPSTATTPTTNATAAAGTAPTSAPTKSGTITIGTVCSCSGADASVYGPNALDVYQAWQDWTNAHGGINGYHVKLIVMDDALNPTTSVAEVKQLIQQDHVMAIVGENSLDDAVWAPYVQQQGVPVIGGNTVDAPMNANPDFYPEGPGSANLQAASFAVMKEHALKHYGMLYCAEAQVCATLVPLSQLGASIIDKYIAVSGAEISNTQPNFDAACLSMKSQGVDALQVGETASTVVRVIDQCAQLGYKPTIVSEASVVNNLTLQDGNFANSYWLSPVANWTDTSIPGVKDYYAALQQYEPQVPSSQSFDINLFWEWVGGQMFVQAAENAHITPSSTSADVKAGLYAFHNETLDGLTSPLNYTKGQPTNPAAFFTMQIQGGKLVGNTLNSLTSAQVTALDKGLAHL